eukprot:6208621-Pleurochrysis_carterae.AAC.1
MHVTRQVAFDLNSKAGRIITPSSTLLISSRLTSECRESGCACRGMRMRRCHARTMGCAHEGLRVHRGARAQGRASTSVRATNEVLVHRNACAQE